LEATAWSGQIRTPQGLHQMLWPRLIAVAERSWHQAEWESLVAEKARSKLREEDWIRFAKILGSKELARLEKLGIDFYLPRPIIRYQSLKIMLHSFKILIHPGV